MTALLKRRLAEQESLCGVIVKMPAAAQLQMAAAAGFDFAIVDLEHGTRDGALLESDLQAAKAVALPALVRVPSGDAPTVLAALDAGASGIVVPHVSTPETAREAVAAAQYPPAGRRSFALTTPAGRWGASTNDAHLRAAADSMLVVVQIEDALGVSQADGIAAVPGIDALFIGLNDLSLDLVGRLDGSEPRVAAARDAILAAGKSAGRPVMTVTSSPGDAAAWRDRGARVSVYVAPSLMLTAMRSAVAGSQSASTTFNGDLPLLLAPGMLEDVRIWRRLVERLSDEVILVPARIDLDDTVEAMAESLLASAPPRFHLVGHSLGGVVALEAALQAPERIASLIVLNAGARVPDSSVLKRWEALRERLQAGNREALLDLADSVADSGAPAGVNANQVAMNLAADGVLRQFAAQAARRDLRSRLSSLRCPVLVLSGDSDRVSPSERQQELVGLIPQAQLHMLTGCGHAAPLEQPDELAAVMRIWLGLEPAVAASQPPERT